MSLPLAFKTELASIPCDIPYLKCAPERIAHWRDKLGPRTGSALRVGLTWAGDPRKHMQLANLADRQRSMHFDQFRPLLEVPGVEFYSLQLGPDAVAQMNGDQRVIDHAALLFDFQETAALMENLDLVICVDTSVVHLAGAIGKKTWMLNRYNTCWRWLLERSDSPWYPTVRIFRQASFGDWPGVVAEVREALFEAANTGL
jgi:hypothetical protein